MKVVMLLSNGFGPDPRVAAEAVALHETGHQVTIFAWDRTGELPLTEDYHGIQIIRCQIKSVYSKGPWQLFKFSQFWLAALRFLKKHPAEAIHCHDLDTLWPGVHYGRKRGLPVIFDAHESYPDMVEHLLPKILVFFVRSLERTLVPQTTSVITVGELLAKHYHDLKAKKVTIVGNYKNLLLTEPLLPPKPEPLKVIYVGGLNRDRLIAPMMQAVTDDDRFEFHIVGDGTETEQLQHIAAAQTNIKFWGFLPQDRARTLIDQCHLVYYAVDGTYQNNQYSMPNLLFLALASGRPLITTHVGEIAQVVEKEQCGTVLPNLEPATIRQALLKYLDQSWWQQLSGHSFQAAKQKYHWKQAKENLIGLYQELEPFHE